MKEMILASLDEPCWLVSVHAFNLLSVERVNIFVCFMNTVL